MARRISSRQMQILAKDSGKEPLVSAEVVKRTKEDSHLTTNGNIAAIDFGTTSVSLAYTTAGDDVINTLILDTEKKSSRIANAILLCKNDDGTLKVDAFGQLAREKYSKVRDGEREKYIYFERIKMLMRRDKNIHRETPVESFAETKFYLVEVVAFILKYLKDVFLAHLKGKVSTDFDWVITVPAIWDPRGKKMMREAAYLAGLLTANPGINKLAEFKDGVKLPCPEEVNADKLCLALEPECAALYSQANTETEVAKADDSRFLQPKGAYMVLDIGGGTVDITAQVKRGDTYEVINAPSGNDWGGTKVNEEFSKLLQEIVDDEGFQNFLSSGDDKAKNQILLNQLMYSEFEQQKLTFGESLSPPEEMAIILPRALVEFYGAKCLKKGALAHPGVDYDDDNETLYIKSHIVEKDIFGPVIQKITECVMIAIDNTHEEIDTYYFVGGFGGCKYLYQSLSDVIIKKYGSKRNMLVPTRPILAIAQGAVHWRRNPENISSRISDATYGIPLLLAFDEERHDPHYKVYNKEHGKYICSDVYAIFRQRGDVVRPEELYIIRGVSPAAQSMDKLKFDILSTVDRGVQYIKDKDGTPTADNIGELVIHVPNEGNLPREKRLVDVTMNFSGTEIQAKAKYLVTGEEVKTVCDFLCVAKPFAK